MIKPQLRLMPFMIGAAMVLVGPAAMAQDFQEVVTKRGQIDENIVAGGKTVTVDAQVAGDVVLAGETVVIGGQVAEDVLSGGRHVVINGTVVGDVRVVGYEVTPNAQIGGDLMAAAYKITVPGGTAIGGNVWLGGHNVELGGATAGDVRVAGRNVRIAGFIDGNVDLSAESITITSSARISGDLTYRSIEEAEIEPGAEILGDTVFIRTEAPKKMVGGALASMSAFGVLFLVGLFLLGALQLLIFPNTATGPANRMGSNPWSTLGLGAAILIVGPIAMILLGISVIGIPITIVLAAFYVIALFLGFVVAAGAIGRLAISLTGRSADISYWTRVGALAAGLLLMIVISFVPVVGPLAIVLATALGLGALAHQARKGREQAT